MPNGIRVTYFDTAMLLMEAGGLRLLSDLFLDPADSAFDYRDSGNGMTHGTVAGLRLSDFIAGRVHAEAVPMLIKTRHRLDTK
jgi:hypothetical protein